MYKGTAFYDACWNIDKNKMIQVLRNLCSNALKFSPAGGVIQVKLLFYWQSTEDVEEDEDASDDLGSGESMDNYDNGSAFQMKHKLYRENNYSRIGDNVGDQWTNIEESEAVELNNLMVVEHIGEITNDGADSRTYTRTGINPSTDMHHAGDDSTVALRQLPSFVPTSMNGGGGDSKDVGASNRLGGGGVEAANDMAHVRQRITMLNVTDDPLAIRAKMLGKTLMCSVEVRDTGRGMAASDIAQIFGKHSQFKPLKMKKGGGGGLGLWRKYFFDHLKRFFYVSLFTVGTPLYFCCFCLSCISDILDFCFHFFALRNISFKEYCATEWWNSESN